jgi:hypothetical protein
MPVEKRRGRPAIPISKQVQVFFEGGWICSLCYRPTIFPPAMRFAALLVQNQNYELPIAYHHPRWRRDAAPLLDHFGSVIDHVDAYSRGGAHELRNFAVACNKCNVVKSDSEKADHLKRHPPHKVKGKHGEPKYWDGLASLFVVLARQNPEHLTASERVWLRALEEYIQAAKPAA